MALVTLSERLSRIEARLAEVDLKVIRVSQYAEQTQRMHHDAIVRLAKLAGEDGWPAQR